MLSLGFFVVEDTEGGGKDDETELSGGEEIVDEFLEVLKFEVVSGGDNSTFIESAVKFNNDFATSSVINDFEFINVT